MTKETAIQKLGQAIAPEVNKMLDEMVKPIRQHRREAGALLHRMKGQDRRGAPFPKKRRDDDRGLYQVWPSTNVRTGPQLHARSVWLSSDNAKMLRAVKAAGRQFDRQQAWKEECEKRSKSK